ncbi:MAG: hypothetical protein AB7S26_30950 [Sandaracinaceae bacterium]
MDDDDHMSMWPEKPGMRVHSWAVHKVVPPLIKGMTNLDDRYKELMLWQLAWAVSDRHADRCEWQAAEYSYRHAMTPGGWKEQDAYDEANRFIRDSLRTSDQWWKTFLGAPYDSRQETEALKEMMNHLGLAMHCMQDSTSPAHNYMKGGKHHFIVYEGTDGDSCGPIWESVGTELATHVAKEAFWPGDGSNLFKATELAFTYWRDGGTRPQDFFTGHGVDAHPGILIKPVGNNPVGRDPQNFDRAPSVPRKNPPPPKRNPPKITPAVKRPRP